SSDLPPGQDLEEQRVGARVAAHVFLDQFGVAPSHAHRLGMDLEAFLLGNLEQLDEAYRVLPEPLRARSTDLAGCDLISFEQPRPTAEAGEQTARAPALLRHLLVDVSQEHAGQMPNRLRLHEVVLHEALDRALSRSF